MHWWIGMHNPKVQLLVYGDDIGSYEVNTNYAGVTIEQIHKVENANYVFVDLHIAATAKAGIANLEFKSKTGKKFTHKYELRARTREQLALQGVNSSDFIYLIMPDRFANGNPKNDQVKGMNEMAVNRDSMYYRHGGDLDGITQRLDYLQDLGVTAIWLNPVLTNDQPKTSYHGYANTENYYVDPRFGGNEAYKKLIDASHKRGMKIIQDLVHNHVGTAHYTIKDMPMKDWVHQWPAYTKTNYREQVHMDPYAAKVDKAIMVDGWFDRHMPDMNQANPFVRNYITQSHIWWIEEVGLDGFRIDTYAYNDLDFMAEWGRAIAAEYPKMTFFGETWVHGVPNQAYFTKGNKINQGLDTELQGVTDFQTYWAILDALQGKTGWMEGLTRLYNTFANDFMYEDATQNVNFLDNHDVSRYYSQVGEDFERYKSGVAWLLTTRGIPQFYYGTEILMKNFADPDGKVREDFPGGWQGDSANKFEASNRTQQENEAFDFVKTLANYRKNNPVLQTGKLMQYIPEDNVYVYFRYNEDKTVMIIMNNQKATKTLDLKRFEERLTGFRTGRNVLTSEILPDLDKITVAPQATLVVELLK